ncbi:hypothetical protein EDB84DRAFT_1616340, partial [Lactarius hengduanensis]
MDSPNANIDEKTLNFPQSELHTEPAGGEKNGGSSGRLWSMCLMETEKKDKMTERWKGEADTRPHICMCWSHNHLHIPLLTHILKAGLFTAITAVSIIESYKWLSPDPGDQTVRLLDQISGQLVDISRGVPLEDVIRISTESFKPDGSAVLVNITWFCSTAICFSCSVVATIIQQCARRYLLLTQGRGTPYERAQLRMFMFHGLEIFQVDRVLLFLSMALHVSILLYSVGIVGFIFRAYGNIGFIAISIFVMSLVMYVFLTAL